jgi:hypothetical protein
MSSFPFAVGQLASAQSLNSSTVVGEVFKALRLTKGTVQMIVQGTVSGNIKIQGSNVIVTSGPDGYSTNPAHWSDIDTTAVAITTSGVVMAQFDTFGAHFLRVFFENTSGTGTADVWFCFKS